MHRIWPFAVAVVLAIGAQAQTSRGTVSGVVTDPSGAVVAHVAVALRQTETGVRRAATTNEAGIYRFDAVDLGTYELKVTYPGFHAFVATELGVEANRSSVVDVRLELGSEAIEVTVSTEAEALTVRDGALRGGNFLPREVSQLPLVDLNPFSLARTLPGVIRPSGSAYGNEGGGEGVQFSVNGQRVHGNNFLLDGTDNNDITFTGIAQPFNMPDAVEEVSAQTGNFSVEFGRAAGAVLNVITKSGANSLHGTLSWRYQSQRFNSVSNLARLNGAPKSVFVHNVPGFTAGGPIRKDKTFFFAGFQQDTNRATGTFPLVVPTAPAVEQLRSIYPSNPRLDLYLSTLGDLRGTANQMSLPLGVAPQTGVDRGPVLFASAPLALRQTNGGPEWLVRFDHYRSEAHRLSARYIYDSRLNSPGANGSNGVQFPGFILDSGDRNQNFQFADSYTFGPTYTNEFRFSYARLEFNQASVSSQSVPLAQTLPRITITNIDSPGLSNALQFHDANNFLFQETQTKLAGRHTFRYGVELLRQLATQQPNAYPLGQIDYRNSPGYSALANFLDDFSGSSGRIRKTVGASIFHPNVFRQSYFFEDTWKTTRSLTLTLGLRYENFGQVANALRYPAFTGFDPNLFFKPNRVNADDKDFGPAFGLAWSPSFSSGLADKLFGNHKMVWRGGYQISYQPLYTQALSLDLAASTPNAIMIDQTSTISGRGDPNWSAQLPASTPRPPTLTDTQYGTLEKEFRNPYTERWSFGFQRQMPGLTLLDVSYVGAEGHKLTTRADMNPQQPGGPVRLYPDFGPRTVRTSQGNSAYHSLQARMDRRFAHGLQATASYTWSKSLDSTSEGILQVETQYISANLTSVPAAQGGLKLDRGPSDFDRGQRLALSYLWEIPGPSKGLWRHVMGGWSVAGIAIFQSGTPYTAINGFDRNGDGWLADRPDIGNPGAARNSRAVLWTPCATGYRNQDTLACMKPSDAYWVEGAGFPNASTVGRNTLFTNGTNNFDLSLFKSFAVRERGRLEFRWEAQNGFNHQQFVQVPQRDVVNTPPGQFLNRDFTDSGIRSMWVQVKLLF